MDNPIPKTPSAIWKLLLGTIVSLVLLNLVLGLIQKFAGINVRQYIYNPLGAILGTKGSPNNPAANPPVS